MPGAAVSASSARLAERLAAAASAASDPAAREAESDVVLDHWFAFDRTLDDGRRPVDLLLEHEARRLPVGERRFLETLRASTMRLHEITDVSRGVSVTLRDVLEKTVVTVHERSGSRTLQRHEWLAARARPPRARRFVPSWWI